MACVLRYSRPAAHPAAAPRFHSEVPDPELELLPDWVVLPRLVSIKKMNYPPMSVKQLAYRWGVSTATVRKWLRPFQDELGPRIGQMYSPRQVAIIMEHLE